MADMSGSQFVSDIELTRVISAEYCALYDLLTQKFQQYNTSTTPYQFTTVVGQLAYDLPSDFYKVAGVDKQDGGASTGWLPVNSFNFGERNSYAAQGLRYCLLNNQILLNDDQAGRTLRVWYTPAPKKLAATLKGMTFDYTTSTVTYASHGMVEDDVIMFNGGTLPTGIIVGDPNGTLTRGKYYIVNPTTDTFQIALTQGGTPVAFTSNGSGSIRGFWFGEGQTIDGVSGWEEMIVCNAAIYMKNKEEADVGALLAVRKDLIKRINDSAQIRDISSPSTVQDVTGSVADNWVYFVE